MFIVSSIVGAGRRAAAFPAVLALGAWLVACGAVAIGEERPFAKRRLHLTDKPFPAPRVKLVFADEPTPELRAWGEEAEALIREWWPQIGRLLATESFEGPADLALVFKSEQEAPAYRTSEGIFVNRKHVERHPDDFGMIIHELTHAIQDYRRPPRDTGWLIEGIADYVRYWHYEPEARRPTGDLSRANYRAGYGVTADFLAFLVARYDRRIVRRLDAALRDGSYTDALFQEITGKNLDVLWNEFRAAVRAARAS